MLPKIIKINFSIKKSPKNVDFSLAKCVVRAQREVDENGAGNDHENARTKGQPCEQLRNGVTAVEGHDFGVSPF
jgi:hypothetical protein